MQMNLYSLRPVLLYIFRPVEGYPNGSGRFSSSVSQPPPELVHIAVIRRERYLTQQLVTGKHNVGMNKMRKNQPVPALQGGRTES